MPDVKPARAPDGMDAEWVRQAQAGSLEAFERLVSLHERRVYFLALRITGHTEDAQDVTQETFISALEHIDGFRGEARFSTWLLRIATHAALKVIRGRKTRKTVSLDQATGEDETGRIPHPEYVASWRDEPARLLEQSQTRKLLEDALTELDDAHRVVFLLRDVEGFSVRETAEAAGLTEANVKVRLLRARLKLRERLTRALGRPETRVATGERHGDV